MMFKYKAISQSGQVFQGKMEAINENEIILKLKEQNYLPIKIEKSLSIDFKKQIFLSKLSKKELSLFCRQFYTMLNSGINILKILDILEKQSKNKRIKSIYKRIYEKIQKGNTLSESMKFNEKLFPNLLIGMIEAGEISGNLDNIMYSMAVHYERENKITNKIKSALIYPAILAIISLCIIIFLLVFVLPTFISMISVTKEEMPIATKILLSISEFLKNSWGIILFSIIGMILLIKISSKNTTVRFLFDTIKVHNPTGKKAYRIFIISKFIRTLGICFGSGISVIKSIETSANVLDNLYINKKLNIVVDSVKEGMSISKSIENIKIFPPMVYSMIEVGEESGDLENILYKTSDFYDEELDYIIKKHLTILEPALLIIMAIIVGFIVIAMIVPMYDGINIL